MEKKIDSFARDLESVRRKEFAAPKRLDINLALALTDQEYVIGGSLFYVWAAPANTYIDVRINRQQEPPIRFEQQTGMQTPFHSLFITTPAGQAGTLTIIYGTEADLLRFLDNRSALAGNVDAIRDELQGDTVAENFIGITITAAPGATLIMAARATRKGCSVQALSTNTGPVFVGFLNTVTVGGAPGIWCWELTAGRPLTMDDYRGPLYGIATAQQIVGTGEW